MAWQSDRCCFRHTHFSHFIARPISAEKVPDIKKLLKYGPPVNHSSFETILSALPPTPEQHNYEDKLLCESEVTDEDTDDCQQNKAELMVIVYLKLLRV